jgi:5-formyltetrahydrofolate cyclo-ligase
MTDKAALRKRLRARRAAISPAQRRIAGRQLVRLALRHRLLARRRRIGFYMPSKNEIDILPLLRTALRMGVTCYLPVVPRRALVSVGRRALWFSRIDGRAVDLDPGRSGWRSNRYAIPEYLPRGASRVRARHLDLLLTPLLGFDRQGWRIGMGGGYYDASLAFLKRRRYWRKPHPIGVAFAAQEVEQAPHDAWDIPLDGILDEREFIRARRSTG